MKDGKKYTLSSLKEKKEVKDNSPMSCCKLEKLEVKVPLEVGNILKKALQNRGTREVKRIAVIVR